MVLLSRGEEVRERCCEVRMRTECMGRSEKEGRRRRTMQTAHSEREGRTSRDGKGGWGLCAEKTEFRPNTEGRVDASSITLAIEAHQQETRQTVAGLCSAHQCD